MTVKATVVACPVCGAKRGERCVGVVKSGLDASHVARVWRWLDETPIDTRRGAA